jgi:hypothetical protein
MRMLGLDRGRSMRHGAGFRASLGRLRLNPFDHLTDQRGDNLLEQMSPAGERLEGHDLRAGELARGRSTRRDCAPGILESD